MPQKIKAEGLPGQAGWEKEKRLPELSMPTHRLLQPFCVHSLKVKLGRGLTLPRERDCREGFGFSICLCT